MWVGKDVSSTINSEMLVYKWDVKYSDTEDIIEKYGGQIPIGTSWDEPRLRQLSWS